MCADIGRGRWRCVSGELRRTVSAETQWMRMRWVPEEWDIPALHWLEGGCRHGVGFSSGGARLLSGVVVSSSLELAAGCRGTSGVLLRLPGFILNHVFYDLWIACGVVYARFWCVVLSGERACSGHGYYGCHHHGAYQQRRPCG